MQLAYDLSCLPCEGSLDARGALGQTGHHWPSQTVGRKIEGAEGAGTGSCEGRGGRPRAGGEKRCVVADEDAARPDDDTTRCGDGVGDGRWVGDGWILMKS